MSYRGIACGQEEARDGFLIPEKEITPAAVGDETPRGWGVGAKKRGTVAKECKQKKTLVWAKVASMRGLWKVE